MRDDPVTSDRAPGVGRIISGGQTGADRAATDFAIAHAIPTGGWVPRGGWAEDFPVAPGLLAVYPGFIATASDDPSERTRRNVESADATLVLVLTAASSPGTAVTRSHAAALGAPISVVDLSSPTADAMLVAFVESLPSGCTLNVAGPRESEQPGIYDAARAILERNAASLVGASRR